ncbi:MAG: PAS domain S-box protein [Acidobacteria bacterium]|nr:PAS domain S-box protein [Acidobacteriota bacterium]
MTALIWRGLAANERANSERETTLAAESVAHEIETQMMSRLLVLVRMAWRWEVVGAPAQQEWETDAQLYLHTSPGYHAVGWVDSSLQLVWTVPAGEEVAGLNLREGIEQWQEVLLTAKNERSVKFAHTAELAQGGKGFLVCVPIFRGQDFSGLIVGLFRAEDLFGDILRDTVLPGYSVLLFEEGDLVHARAEAQASPPPETHEKDFHLYGTTWQLELWPTADLRARQYTRLPAVVLASGLLMALVLSSAVHLGQLARTRALEAEAACRKLRDEVAVRKLTEEGFRQQAEILDQVHEPVVSTDLTGYVTSCNRAAQKLLGTTAEAMLGKYLPFLSPQHEHEFFTRHMLAPLLERRAHAVDVRLRKSSGEEVSASLALSLLHDESGQPAGIIYTIRPTAQ